LHRGLKSGTELERLEINEDSGYSRVKTSDGLEGWLQTQYLVEAPVAAILLEDTVGQLEKLEADHQQALLRLREAREVSDELTAAKAAMQQEIDRLNNELQAITDLAADTISIDEENRQLSEGRDALLGQIDALIEENDTLGDNRAQEWFLRGAGTILLGLLFGFWIGRRIYHRRNTGGWA
jgi:SH3 domain protein